MKTHACPLALLSCLLAAVLPASGCRGLTTKTRQENQHTVVVDTITKRSWQQRRFRIDSLDFKDGKLLGSLSVEMPTALATITRTRTDYDLVTYRQREKLCIETFGQNVLRGVPRWYDSHGPAGAAIALPVLLVAEAAKQTLGPIIEILTAKGISGEYAETILSRQPSQGHVLASDPEPAGRELVTQPAPRIPLLVTTTAPGATDQPPAQRTITSDDSAHFSLAAVAPPGFTTPAQAKTAALEKLQPFFLTPQLAEQFLAQAPFTKPATLEIKVATSAKSVCDNEIDRSRTYEDTRTIALEGCILDPEQLDKALHAYLLDAIGPARPVMTSINITVCDSITRAPLSASAEIEASFLTGVSRETVQDDLRRALLQYIKPDHVWRFLPKLEDLPEILRLPARFDAPQPGPFRIHLPAAYRLKATAPGYLPAEILADFTPASTQATLYLEKQPAAPHK